MTLARKDLKVYFDAEHEHPALIAIARIDGVAPHVWCERAILAALERRVHDASVLMQRIDVAGFSRLRQVSAGSDRSPAHEEPEAHVRKARRR